MIKFKYTIIEDSLKVCRGIKERMDDFPQWECCGFLHRTTEAIEKIKAHTPHLIFIDWSLKGGSAYEVLSEICSLSEYAPYIIFNTGYQSENPEIPQHIINNYKIDKYLVKPLWENLRLHLGEYLKEAERRSTHPMLGLNKVWLADIARNHHQVEMNSIVCALQHSENPYCKIIILDSAPSITLKISWEKMVALFENHKIDYFVTNCREHIIVKDHIQFYKRPYVRLYHFKHKIEVVKNRLAAFEEWIANP